MEESFDLTEGTEPEPQEEIQEKTEAESVPEVTESVTAEAEETLQETVASDDEEENGRPFDDTTPDLPPTGPALDILTPYPVIRYAATSSEAVSIGTIHNDIQLLNISFLLAFVLFFTLFLVRGWR